MLEAARLERELADLAQERAACQALVRELLDKEADGQAGLAAAIHQAKQRRMMLATQTQHLKARLNALLLNVD
jgi:hypothetical protein